MAAPGVQAKRKLIPKSARRAAARTSSPRSPTARRRSTRSTEQSSGNISRPGGDTDVANDLYERAADGSVRLISDGVTMGLAQPLFFVSASAAGDRVLFRTREPIAGTGDVDTAWDTYERAADGTLRLITAGSANIDAFVFGTSSDGRRAWFETEEAIPGTGDTDTLRDVYERAADGGLRLISRLGGGDGPRPASFAGGSPDGRRVWWTTEESYAAIGDTDAARDVYERQIDGTLRLVSTGGANVAAYFTRALQGGKQVLFSTAEALPGTGDSDQGVDLYTRVYDGTLRLISTSGSNDQARFLRASDDGTRVWFQTAEAIPGTGDANFEDDIFERHAANPVRLISGGGSPPPGFPLTAVEFAGASPDGTHVYFESYEAIPRTGDTDPGKDVFVRINGATRLLSTSGAGLPASFLDVSPDRNMIRFETREAIPGTGDVDIANDIYEQVGATVTLVSPGTSNVPANFSRAAGDGRTLWFETAEALTGTGDADAVTDVYERRPGSPVRLITGDTPAWGAFFLTASSSGDRVVFNTWDAIPGTGDVDGDNDVYEAYNLTFRLLSG